MTLCIRSQHPDLSEKLDEFQQYLIDSSRELPELKAWQISDLGSQAVQIITESEDSLLQLQELSQNLPVLGK